MHVFPSYAPNKNPDTVIKARLITESLQIMHIFLPRPGKNGLYEQVEIQFLRICSLYLRQAYENSRSRSLFDIFYQSDGNKNEFASNYVLS